MRVSAAIFNIDMSANDVSLRSNGERCEAALQVCLIRFVCVFTRCEADFMTSEVILRWAPDKECESAL